MKKIAILASGNGSNAENIYRFFANGNRVAVTLVIYDRPDAGVAERMKDLPGVKTVYIPASVWNSNPQEIIDLLHHEEIDLVALAGFLRYIPAELTAAFNQRMLNIHPSLLPAHSGPGMYGANVHRAAIEAGDAKSGATVHYVSDVIDGGEILMQQEVEISEGETPESLGAKVLRAEHELYPRAIVAALSRLEYAPRPRMETDSAESGPNLEELNPDHEKEIYISGDQDGKQAEHHRMPPAIAGVTPPPTPAEEWADALGIQYDPEKDATAFPRESDGEAAAPGEPGEGSATAGTDMTALSEEAFGFGRDASAYSRNQHHPVGADPNHQMPPSYLVWAVVMTVLCCLPAGVVAIIFSCQVSSKFYAGDILGARRASERAQIWIIVSFVLGIMANTLYLPLMLLA